jgi:Ca2+-binding RTX toxin-like protein
MAIVQNIIFPTFTQWAAPGVFFPAQVFGMDIAQFATGDLFIAADSTTLSYLSNAATGPDNGFGLLAGTTGALEGWDPQSTRLNNGNLVTVFNVLPNGADDIAFQITSPNKTGTAPNQTHTIVLDDTVLSVATGNVQRPSVATLTNGDFVVVWQRTDGTSSGIFGKVFNEDGTPDGGSPLTRFVVDDDTNSINVQGAQVVRLTGGGFAVVYSQTKAGGGTDLYFKVFTDAGVQVTGPALPAGGSLIDAAGHINGGDPANSTGNARTSVVATDDGGFLVAYEDSGYYGSATTAPTDITVVHVSAGGVIGVPSRLGFVSPTLSADDTPDITSIGSGRFAVTFVSNGIVWAQVVDGAGAPVGGSTPQQLSTTNNSTRASVTGGNGEFWAAWNTGVVNGAYNRFAPVHRATGDAADDTFASLAEMRASIDGGGGNDVLTGAGLGDTIFGNTGNDLIAGGAGNDLLIGGVGTDTVSFVGEALTGARINLESGSVLSSLGTLLDNLSEFEVVFDSDGSNEITGFANAASRLEGRGGNDTIFGGSAADTLLGGDNDDIIAGGAGVDSLDGGSGIDTLDMISEPGFTGGTIDLANERMGIGSPFETIIGFEAVFDSDGSNIIFGSGASALRLEGRGGNDTITGSSSADTILGGLGNDFIRGGAGVDSLDGGDGTDTLDLTAEPSFTGGIIDLANERMGIGSPFETIIGFEAVFDSDGSNIIFGSGASALRLEGRGGNDTITGSSSADTILGGMGNDIIRGGAGVDSLDGGADRDTLDLSSQTTLTGATINLVNGVMTSAEGTETVTGFEAVFDSDGSNRIFGHPGGRVEGRGGNDTINGGPGVDTILGGTGNDLIFDSFGSDSLDGGADIDTISYQDWVGSSFTINLESGLVTGPDGIETITNFEAAIDSNDPGLITGLASAGSRLEGRGGNDTLFSGAANDTILGGDGDDRIVLSLGFDSMDGGADTDLLDANWLNIPVTFNLAAGTLSGQPGVLTILNFENAIDGSGSSSLIGTAVGNRLDGAGGDDTLRGGDGNDTLIGGSGGDVLDGGNGTLDIASYRAATAAVVVYAATPASNQGEAIGDSYIGIEGFELSNLVGSADTFFGGTAGEAVVALAGDDIVFGNGGADTIDGGDGADFLLPGAGNDVIVGGNGFDAVFYGDSAAAVSLNLATGVHGGFALNDTFTSIEAFLLTEQGDTVIGADNASAGDILYGLGGADSLVGQGGFDYLLGGDGADTLNGGFGYDLFTGGAGADRFVFNSGFEGGAFAGGGEVITDFSSAQGDKIAFVGASSGFSAFTLGGNLFIQNGGVTGSQGSGAGPTLIYDRTAGALWFDANGNQAGGLQYLASLLGTPTLTAADFIVI